MLFAVVVILLITCALTGLGVGLGAIYPRFEYDNIAQTAARKLGIQRHIGTPHHQARQHRGIGRRSSVHQQTALISLVPSIVATGCSDHTGQPTCSIVQFGIGEGTPLDPQSGSVLIGPSRGEEESKK